MAHLTSAPSLHAAHVVLQQYELSVLLKAKEQNPKFEADLRCVAIVIDHGTKIFHVVQLRPELRYWQQRMEAATAEASHIAAFFERLLKEFEKLPQHDPKDEEKVLPLDSRPLGNAPTFMGPLPTRPAAHVISRPAMEAARLLYSYYDIATRIALPAGTEEKARLALLIDATTEVFRCVPLARRVKVQQGLLLTGKLTAERVAQFLLYVGLELEHLPNYEEREEEVKLLAA